MNNEELLAFALAKGARTLVVIDSQRGNPSGISFTSISRDHKSGAPIKFRITGVRLERELTGETRTYQTRKLMVLKGKNSTGPERFTRMLAGFLEGNVIESADFGKLQSESGNKCVALKVEEGSEEIILRFVDAKSLRSCGPQIKVKGEDFSPDDVGGSSVD